MKLWMGRNGRKRDDKENLGESVRRGEGKGGVRGRVVCGALGVVRGEDSRGIL